MKTNHSMLNTSKAIKLFIAAITLNCLNATAQTSALTVKGGSSAGLFIGNASLVQAMGNLDIASTGTMSFASSGTPDLRIKGNFTNSGTFTCGTSAITLNGSAAQATAGVTYHSLTINNTTSPATSAVSLSGNANVGGTLTLTSGILNTGANTIDLGANGSIAETAIAPTSYVTGFVKATRNTGSSSGTVTFGGMGLSMTETSKTNNSTVVIRRTGTASVGAGNNSILRYFDITPAVDNSMSGTIVFNYTNAELNGQTEDSLKIYKSTDGGTTWSKQPTTVNIAANTLTTTGITSFSRWTASNKVSAPLPVEFLSFNAKMKDKIVELHWQTATETNNDYFVIQRSVDGLNWISIDSVNGTGTTNSISNYSYTDDAPLFGVSYYRLKQVDFDLKFSFSNVAVVNFDSFEIIDLFPNPSSGNFNLVLKSSLEATVDITVYNAIGQIVKTQQMQVTKGVNTVNAQFEGATGKYLITAKSTDGKYYDYTMVLNK
ncbi:MAG: hypothetical protein RLZZ175_3169 [Bacteroidota bacterium]|jgi:hypothetical protein